MNEAYNKDGVMLLDTDVFKGIEYLREIGITVDCIVTSPPYWGLRNNQETARWWGGGECTHRNVVEKSRRLGGSAGNQHPSSGIQSGKATTVTTSIVAQALDPRATTKVCEDCGSWFGSLGAEEVLDCGGRACESCYVCHISEVAEALKTILADDGVFFLNIGDSQYGTHPGAHAARYGSISGSKDVKSRNYAPANMGGNLTGGLGLKPKDVSGVPTRVVEALQKKGWFRRSDIIWAKGISLNKVGFRQLIDQHLKDIMPMLSVEAAGVLGKMVEAIEENLYVGSGLPESVKDRPTRTYEYIFMLTKRPTYYSNMKAVAEPAKPESKKRYSKKHNPMQSSDPKVSNNSARARSNTPDVHNLRNVWMFPPKGFDWQLCKSCYTVYSGAEIRRMEVRVQPQANWKDIAKAKDEPVEEAVNHVSGGQTGLKGYERRVCPECGEDNNWQSHYSAFPEKLPETCILMGCKPGGIVLDPFAGSATTLLVARRLGHEAIGFEMNVDYQMLAAERLKRSE